MNYIIDANNLAGSLNILSEKDFDKQLIDIVREWIGDKQKIVVLVFDSLDPLGDRYSEGFLEVIYSPRDKYYKTADDKILEIFREWSRAQKGDRDYSLNIINRLSKDDLAFVSNDRDLISRVEEFSAEISENIELISCDRFIAIMEKKENLDESREIDEDRGLNTEEIDEINDELLKKWTKKQ